MIRWRVKEDWIEPLIYLGAFGWLPLSLGVNALTGGSANRPSLGCCLVLAVWFGIPLLVGVGFLLRHLVSLGQRVGPSTQLLEQDPRWRLAKHQLRRAAEQLLDPGEEIRGHGIAATATVQLGEHKDAEILKCVGLKPREVVHHLGREVAGGTRTVERVREGAGGCRWCGREWPK